MNGNELLEAGLEQVEILRDVICAEYEQIAEVKQLKAIISKLNEALDVETHTVLCLARDADRDAATIRRLRREIDAQVALEGAMKQQHRCAECNRDDVRLYRYYASFLRDSEIFCRSHAPEGEPGKWMVALVEDVDGTVWGISSAPADAQRRFYALPEAPEKVPEGDTALVVDTAMLEASGRADGD